ncbi:hypothetical protein E3P81_02156 [Wallemia ichthyophaga]|uniref:HTH psq-type domain-containing protein n=1 Tax=Wallemia ichthyophaga TaxID=245174 RepID=A0A4T0K4X9_WALIC|nr:hypothetical protein E3P97_02155 [Wallemia ichthyophaga]TIB32758.1 hypothetical protein E3P85_01704 [Wallemia ichthyophaga]TIB38448.1 hypothetical protein E3P86_01620 [Wallemia ichthyophaga]TIB46514.1 hypothetical protein E3P82_02153 [Wallemia ichthyophaga]TIB50518.1 hypothetical protein E3P81_02156 [Wallemia ichthyophaga]
MNTVLRKRKLTTEQKNNIVKLAKTNPKMRQDEIARQFGVDRSTISKVLTDAKKARKLASDNTEFGNQEEPVEQLTQDNYSHSTGSRSRSCSNEMKETIHIQHFDSLSFTNYISYEEDEHDDKGFVSELKVLDALGVVKKFLEERSSVEDIHTHTHSHSNNQIHTHSHNNHFIPNTQDITNIDNLFYRIQSSIDEDVQFY